MQMCTPRQLPMKVTFRIRPMPSCCSMKAHAYNTFYLLACHHLGSKRKVWPALTHMQNTNFGNVRDHRRSTTDDLLFDIWGTRWFACSKQDTLVTARSPMQLLMKLQRLQFYTWLPQRSAQHKKKELTLYGSHVVDNLEAELDFYFTSTKTMISLQKTTHEYYNQHEPL